METNFSVAVQQLLKANPEQIMLQLYELNLKIQTASSEEIIAIYYTLKGVDHTIDGKSAESKQIFELKNSAASRMATFIILAKEPARVHALYNGVVGYDKKVDDAFKATK